MELIEHVPQVKGPVYLCDEIMRDEQPLYVQHSLHWDILSFLKQEDFTGRRLLDFGPGSGASSMVLARMFPQAEIVGVELVPELVELARHRARFYGVEARVTFSLSPEPSRLPTDIGQFDYIIFSAVFEHLLPEERETMLPVLWSYLKEAGIIFLDQTPYRWFPVEMHTTGLPLINYLPDGLAFRLSRRFSKRIKRDVSWQELLRKGIRGGTTQEISNILDRKGRRSEFLAPSELGVKDDIDLWYRRSSSVRKAGTKKLTIMAFRALKAVTGATILPTLSLAIKKVQ
ncbi:bifunctional 2-polyprenyl-6-hydroxyphenol methylase/3-demethylubiquinol 3-O-methyltransferase UbiG [Pelagibius sp. Alg239-R121]|uniref:class I SAM-dependent methyltransferase n=1 Tax=Pelagibius sp. Alg239-R121 TaxID=2993448 RepID=UPI0024A76E5C|nr:class I SAM-dependent methyltransferase [Pelagibius sp. Alg239-R121]